MSPSIEKIEQARKQKKIELLLKQLNIELKYEGKYAEIIEQ